MSASREDRKEWTVKAERFEHDVGDEVVVYPPHAGWGMWGTVEERVPPLEYPKRRMLSVNNLIYMPSSRRWGTTTRKRSYLVRLGRKGEEAMEMWVWATVALVRKG